MVVVVVVVVVEAVFAEKAERVGDKSMGKGEFLVARLGWMRRDWGLASGSTLAVEGVSGLEVWLALWPLWLEVTGMCR